MISSWRGAAGLGLILALSGCNNPLVGYRVVEATSDNEASNSYWPKQAVAMCPSDFMVLGGGASVRYSTGPPPPAPRFPDESDSAIISSMPTADNAGWIAIGRNNGMEGPWSVEVKAICARQQK
jgi:hypothetical protein